jgi:hypothetical protein
MPKAAAAPSGPAPTRSASGPGTCGSAINGGALGRPAASRGSASSLRLASRSLPRQVRCLAGRCADSTSLSKLPCPTRRRRPGPRRGLRRPRLRSASVRLPATAVRIRMPLQLNFEATRTRSPGLGGASDAVGGGLSLELSLRRLPAHENRALVKKREPTSARVGAWGRFEEPKGLGTTPRSADSESAFPVLGVGIP